MSIGLAYVRIPDDCAAAVAVRSRGRAKLMYLTRYLRSGFLAMSQPERKLPQIISPEEKNHGQHRVDHQLQAAFPRDVRAGAREDDACPARVPRRQGRVQAER